MAKKKALEYGYTLLKWGRVQCAEWVKSKKCPGCKQRNRLQPGPDWDRFNVWCGNCGWEGRVKPPKEALRESSI